MKFWDTIAKMCGVKVDASQWGGAPAFGASPGGMLSDWERHDLLTIDARGHLVEVRALTSATSLTVDGHGVRIIDTTTATAANTARRIGLIAIERIRPMVEKSAPLNYPTVDEIREQVLGAVDAYNAQDVASAASKAKSGDLREAARMMQQAARIYAASLAPKEPSSLS